VLKFCSGRIRRSAAGTVPPDLSRGWREGNIGDDQPAKSVFIYVLRILLDGQRSSCESGACHAFAYACESIIVSTVRDGLKLGSQATGGAAICGDRHLSDVQTNTPIATGSKQQGYAGVEVASSGDSRLRPASQSKRHARFFDKRNLGREESRALTINHQALPDTSSKRTRMSGPPAWHVGTSRPTARVPHAAAPSCNWSRQYCGTLKWV
jgi:hypothetical protein